MVSHIMLYTLSHNFKIEIKVKQEGENIASNIYRISPEGRTSIKDQGARDLSRAVPTFSWGGPMNGGSFVIPEERYSWTDFQGLGRHRHLILGVVVFLKHLLIISQVGRQWGGFDSSRGQSQPRG